MAISPLWLWTGFTLFILGMLALDLGVLHRKPHEISKREAAIWSAVWIALALVFAAGIWHFRGPSQATEFLAGYLIEKSLSVDNIFVIALIFGYFAVPARHQHRVLFWGILGALAMRAAFVAAGATLLDRFHWIIYLFGGFLVLTGLKMAFAPQRGFAPDRNPIVRLVRRLLPVSDRYHGEKFFVRERGVLSATPLFLVLVLVEATDLIFAVDSIPAIFAVTADPFLVYTSNVFAILGLRSLYFLLAGAMQKLDYLKPGLAAILVFVGAKMALVDFVQIPAGASLAVVAAILAIAVVASLLRSRPQRPSDAPPAATS
ncbi:MAG: TerC family protein [Thermoanaerobaculia bacterium]